MMFANDVGIVTDTLASVPSPPLNPGAFNQANGDGDSPYRDRRYSEHHQRLRESGMHLQLLPVV